MASVLRLRVILVLLRKNFPHLLTRGKAIYNGLSAKQSLFTNVTSTFLALLLSRIQALDQAQQAIGKVEGAAALRNAAAVELITTLETARALVQELVDASPEQGAVLIEAASMKIGQVSTYSKPFLQATQAKPGGAVHLAANVGVATAGTKGKVFFNWQFSVDGGKTWLNGPSTPNGNTDFAGLTAMTTYLFRCNVTHTGDTTEWSQAVSLLVR